MLAIASKAASRSRRRTGSTRSNTTATVLAGIGVVDRSPDLHISRLTKLRTGQDAILGRVEVRTKSGADCAKWFPKVAEPNRR